MTGKKSVRRWEAIAVVLATLFTIFCGSYSLAVSQAASINNALGLQGASVSRSDDAAYIYFPSAYADAQSLETAYLAVCEEVAIDLVKGACKALKTTYAVAATGYAGPTGGTKDIPVGTIWLACGSPDKVVTCMVNEDHGRDINLAIATNKAMQMFLDFLKESQE